MNSILSRRIAALALAIPAAAWAQTPVADPSFVPSPPTFQPRDATYAWDDGQAEASYRITSGAEQGAIHAFVTIPGAELITAVQVAWGQFTVPRPTRIALWNDPTNDGDPADAVLLTEFPVAVLNPDTDALNTYTLPNPVTVSGVFFVGFITGVDPDNFPIRLDRRPGAPAARFYYLGSDTPINANSLAGIYLDWNTSLPDQGYGMIRAVGTASGITYQGELRSSGSPVNAPVDLQFRLYDAAAGGLQVDATTQVAALTPENGRFTVILPYGSSSFTGQPRWLEVRVSPAGLNTYTTLSPRQELTSAPSAYYASRSTWTGISGIPAGFADGIDNDSGGDITAVNAGPGLTGGAASGSATLSVIFAGTGTAASAARSDHTHSAAAIVSGVFPDSRLSANVALLSGSQTFIGANSFSNPSNVFTGTGTTLLDLNASNIAFGTLADARLSTNIPRLTATLNNFLGSMYVNGDNANALASLVVERSTTFNPTLPPLRVRVNNATKLVVDTNGGTVLGASNTTLPPANGLRVAGNAVVVGSISKGSGSFLIDHPLDPANMYLYHSFVESPDMMNIYNGTITTDDRGYASVELPRWFDALNRDFRYQLTVLDADDDDPDQWTNVKVVRRIGADAPNRFTLRASRPGVEVSWQVTGVRKDAFAEKNRVPVEVHKAPADRGRYLHPEAFGLPASRALDASTEPAYPDHATRAGLR